MILITCNIILAIVVVISTLYITYLKIKIIANKLVFEYTATFYATILQCFEEYKKADNIKDNNSSMNVKKESVKSILAICEEARNYREKLKEEINIKQ